MDPGINRDSETTLRTEEFQRNEILDQPLIIKQQIPVKKRLTALDIHRGLTMFGMILVDNAGGKPIWLLEHSQWDGITPADLIFPSFIFIMGMAVPLAINEKNPIRLKTLIRILGLFFIGLLLNLSAKKFDFSRLRIMGILQRISLTYAVIILVHLLTSYGKRSRRFFGALIILVCASVYLALMLSFQNLEIECPKEKNLSPFCNFSGYADRHLFGKDHMINPTDPQGLFSTLSTVITAYAGYYFSLIMFDNRDNIKKVLLQWVILSLFCGLITYLLTFLMPLNKKIWSISFAFLAIGVSGLALAFLVIIMDIIGQTNRVYLKVLKVVTAPFLWLGRNPLAVFVLMDALAIVMIIYIRFDVDGTETSAWSWFYKNAFESWMGDAVLASTIFSLFFVVIWVLVAGLMYRFNIFVKL